MKKRLKGANQPFRTNISWPLPFAKAPLAEREADACDRRKSLKHKRILFRIAALLVLVSLIILGSNYVLTAHAASSRSVLAGSAPSWANAKNYAGAASSSDTIGFRIYLGWNNESAVEAYAQAVSDPHSASYRHYLTPAQFRQQF